MAESIVAHHPETLLRIRLSLKSLEAKLLPEDLDRATTGYVK
jgi:hypothetical protein